MIDRKLLNEKMDRKYLNEKMECMPREELQRLQLKRFQDLFKRARKNCTFYRDFLEEHGAQNVQIKSLEDVQKIPIMSKKENRQAYPDKLVMVPKEQLRQVFQTSGTTGKPTLTFATEKDIALWSERNGRNLWGMGCRPGDRILRRALGAATGGFGIYFGARYINLLVIPTGVGQPERKIELIEDLKITCIFGGAFAIYMGQIALGKGINFAERPYPTICTFGGEPTSKSTRDKIEELWGVKAYDEYGMCELLGPGMAVECERQDGMHVWSDAIFPECVDPKTGERVPDGEMGELVWTFLVSDAMAIVRYRSGDLSRIITEPCPCGRTHVRIASVKGRADEGLKIGGWTVWPSQIEEVLFKFKEAGSNFQCIIDSDERGLDRLMINLEVVDKSLLHDKQKGTDFCNVLRNQLKEALDVTAKGINLVGVGSLPTYDEKTGRTKTSFARMIDRRKKD